MLFFKARSGGDQADREKVTSIIGAEMHLHGDISFKGKLRLDGRVDGNVRGEYLILGETGTVTGDIAVATCVCSGRVQGNVAVRRLHMASKGVVEGKVETMDLTVESGAVLNGEIKSRTQELRLVPGVSRAEEGREAARAKGRSGRAGRAAEEAGSG